MFIAAVCPNGHQLRFEQVASVIVPDVHQHTKHSHPAGSQGICPTCGSRAATVLVSREDMAGSSGKRNRFRAAS